MMIGVIGCVCHCVSCVKGVLAYDIRPSVALAVIIGVVWLCWGGVSPPSTVSMIGDVDFVMIFHTVCDCFCFLVFDDCWFVGGWAIALSLIYVVMCDLIWLFVAV